MKLKYRWITLLNATYWNQKSNWNHPASVWKMLLCVWTFLSMSFFKIGALRNVAIFAGKHLCWSLFFKKLQFWRLLLRSDSNTGVFLWNLRNFSKHIFLQNTSGGCFWSLPFTITNKTHAQISLIRYETKSEFFLGFAR